MADEPREGGGELKIAQDEIKKQQQEDDFNAAMSRINRSSQSARDKPFH